MAFIPILKNLTCIFLIFKVVSCASLNGINSRMNDQELYPLMQKYLNEAVGNTGNQMNGEIIERSYGANSDMNDKDLYPLMEKYLNEAVANNENQMKDEISEAAYGVSSDTNDKDLYPLMEKYLNEAVANNENQMNNEIYETEYGASSDMNDKDLYPLMEKYLNEAVANTDNHMKDEIYETEYDSKLALKDEELYPIMEKYLNEAVGYVKKQKKQKIAETAYEFTSHLSDVESDPEMGKYLREALENFRDQMKEGIPAINMPVLDPLHLQDLDINVDQNVASMSLKIKEITIRDLSTFQIQQLKANLETYYLKLKLDLPAVRAVGKYNLNGRLMRIFPLTGNGAFSINVTNAEITGLGKLHFKDDTLQLNELDLDLSWRDLQIYLENFLGGGGLSKHVQKLLPNVGKNVFDNYKSGILSNLNAALKTTINNELKKPAVKDLIDSLIPRAERS